MKASEMEVKKMEGREMEVKGMEIRENGKREMEVGERNSEKMEVRGMEVGEMKVREILVQFTRSLNRKWKKEKMLLFRGDVHRILKIPNSLILLI